MGANLVRLVFTLDPSEWHGSATERLWAEPLGKDRFRLDNSPFYVFGVSYADIVLGAEVEGQILFRGVVIRGGHSTYRLRLQSHDLSARSFVQAWTPLQTLGCSFEGGPVLSVDVPPSADIHAVYELLQAGEAASVWDFEEGHCGHRLDTRSNSE
jgi:Domain of unknown function (DUF4265)